jgi:hypothetical protein
VLCLVLLACVLWLRAPHALRGNVEASLAASLAQRGLVLARGQVVWLAPPKGPFELRPALFVAKRKGELDDVYYAEMRASDAGTHGAVLDLFFVTNLTRSSSAAEGALLRSGAHVAFTVRVGGSTEAVVVLDTRGEPDRITRGWPLHARAQNAITNLQETGRLRGFGRERYGFATPASSASLGAEDDRFVVTLEPGVQASRVVIDPRRLQPIEGAELVHVQTLEKGRPGTITWVVDTVRNVSFVGPAPIEWLEHTVFGLTDRAKRAYHAVFGADRNADTEMRQALAAVPEKPSRMAAPDVSAQAPHARLLTAADPELGWPPPPLARVLADAVPGEGEWAPVVDEAFVNAYANTPHAFYQTFIRVDVERPYVSVYVTLWDPRQVQLHLAMGTKEPESATGETGSGLIPRDPEVLARLVGAFNGGFQALHGEFGMMAEGRVYLPPKPWAGTVAVFDDGRVGMGSWPGPGKSGWDEERANAQIPADMIAMRQNLTSVVEDGTYNPWKRWWWGAAPETAGEQTFITRSGLCVTAEGHMAFLWGESMGPEQLGKAMLALRCARGIHLDMNSKHTGFEFYRPLAPASAPRPLARALGEMEFEGPIEQGLGYVFRSRMAVKTMSPLRFPRYLGRDPRDFFYLTLKPVLPGPALQLGGHRVAFSTAGLPHAGWPHAFARAQMPGDQGAAEPGGWLVRIDPRRAVAAPLAPADVGRALARLVGVDAAGEGAVALYATRVRGLLRYRIGEPPQDAVVMIRAAELTPGMGARRALAIDAEGYLLYADASRAGEQALASWLHAAGATRALALPDSAQLVFALEDGRHVSVDGEQELQVAGGVALHAEIRPAAQVIFGDVAPMPYQRWGWMQGQRVRYFPSGPPRFRTPEDVMKAEVEAPEAGVAPPAPPP